MRCSLRKSSSGGTSSMRGRWIAKRIPSWPCVAIAKRRQCFCQIASTLIRDISTPMRSLWRHLVEGCRVLHSHASGRRHERRVSDSDLIYAASDRCMCGAGLAYPRSPGPYGAWSCSHYLLERGRVTGEHVVRLPFVFFDVLSEDQPSARGSTTRPTVRKVRRCGTIRLLGMAIARFVL